MANNKAFHDGRRLHQVVEAGTVSGSPCVVGSRGGVALTDRDATTFMATVDFKGVYRLPVTGVTAPGTPVYYTANADPTLRLNVAATALFFGYALETNAGGALTTMEVYVSEASGISTLAAGSLDGTVLDNLAADAPIGGVPVHHFYTVPNMATGTLDFNLTHTTRITDIWIQKTTNTSSAHAHTIQVQTVGGAANISDAISLNNVPRGTIVRAGIVSDADCVVAAGANALRIAVTRADASGQVACIVHVSGVRSA